MSRRIVALAIAGSIAIASTAWAAEGANQGALAAGKPAGVRQAQAWTGHHQLLWLLAGGGVVGGVVFVAVGNGHNAVVQTCPLPGCTPPPTTSTTTTTGTTTTTTTTTTH